ncbi:CPBP family intramembrane glutamic endopeptidase [Micromonospora olivasterospora]|uniref:CPBP family intramembrane glutamic endopeptidase n=1 Tax=Micromonospora olivasterospora TaxID=1880 RepID=UPI0011AA2A25|nr:CPBP family intramembrane glutamic endopeptidase [Micromonospora olivasterospora]
MRGRIEQRACRIPVVVAAELTLAWHVVLFALAELVGGLSASWFPDLGSALVNVGAAAATLAFAASMGWWRDAALGWPRPNRSWWYCLPVVAVTVSYATPGLTGPTNAFISTAVTMLAVGVAEESLSRGINQHVLASLGATRAAVWVGVLFGLGHALSGLWFERPWDDTVAQVISTTAYGFGLAALRWHLGTIWPLVVLHASDNLVQLRSPGAAPLWWQAAVALFFVGYGWWLIRRLPRRPADPVPSDDDSR